ncbi:MAG: 2-oxoacid:acceptor oxidoreductase subunit alpha [Promethearchaeota archaeon]
MRTSSFSVTKKDDISIVLAGAAGQGIETFEQLLTRILKSAGYNIFSTKEYMSRVRGGINSTEIRVASNRVAAFVDRIDILIPLNKDAIPHLQRRITKDTVIIGEKENIKGALECSECEIEIPFSEIAVETGGKIYSNIVAIGLISSLLNAELEIVEEQLKKRFTEKGEKIVNNNVAAARRGFELAEELKNSQTLVIELKKNLKVQEEALLDGTEAVAMGAIAGGCNFICGYPMAPATGVLRFLAEQSVEFDIIVEQIEDEIAGMNAAIGAWYAGGRGLVTTSGGGFALMSEGLSLAGVTETPVVIHLAQRPGPATGLPTRTEQGDLELALYAGHGFFPRVILAPGKIDDAFYLSQKAFNLADKYQVPVFILTDNYLINLHYNLPPLDLSEVTLENHVIRTEIGYQRYKLTESGISPRGIPGFGEGLIATDSHEHDENGHISEDLDYMRPKMVEKRLKKLALLEKDVIPPELIGGENYKTLLIGWGSTFYSIKEAMELLRREDVSFLYFKQVHPLYHDTANYLRKAEKTVLIENNETSQFGKLIKLYTGIDIDYKILKYNGLPFSVEELVEKLQKISI